MTEPSAVDRDRMIESIMAMSSNEVFDLLRPIQKRIYNREKPEPDDAWVLEAALQRATNETSIFESELAKSTLAVRERNHQITEQQRTIWRLEDDLARALRERDAAIKSAAMEGM